MRFGFKGRGSIRSGRDCERKRKKAAGGRSRDKKRSDLLKKRRKGRRNLPLTSYPVLLGHGIKV